MQAYTIATILLSTSQAGSPQATSVGLLTSSSTPTPQASSSPDVGTTSPAITTSSQPELTTSSSLISSTSPETSSSIPTSQPPTSITSSVSSSPHTPASVPAPTTTTTSSSSLSPTSQNNAASTTPTSTYGGQTTSTITSSFVTVIGSSSITSFTLIPTVISSSSTTTTAAADRTSIIAGSVIGGGLLLIIGLSVFFYRQRRRFKHFHFLDAINVRRRQVRARATLLAGEDLEDVDLPRPPPGRYSDYDTPWDPRDSSGSLNDTERGNLMGPIVRGRDIDLSHIVDDVMGPSAPGVHYSQNSLPSSYRDLSGYESEPQTREVSNASQIALLEAAGLSSMGGPSMQPTRSSPLGNNDPVVTGGSNAP
ncbi:hypothetical protein EV702DRAFT_1145862 [Suillus placidus]|uniref:Uncharacterized protein n=1 Tax=Suillus placidus TaxID=48579 RepID=A0A9P6ZJF0_9AGAM|nr:hypothetical protein EV702DRAFT_1145862 [Suillus placidus]